MVFQCKEGKKLKNGLNARLIEKEDEIWMSHFRVPNSALCSHTAPHSEYDLCALSGQHAVSILCRVLGVNRSTYYKHLRHPSSRRQLENVEIRKRILEIYAQSNKRLGAKKMTLCLAREHGITISEGRVYRLMKQMRLPKMSTVKPPKAAAYKDNEGVCQNLLSQRFDQKAPIWYGSATLPM